MSGPGTPNIVERAKKSQLLSRTKPTSASSVVTQRLTPRRRATKRPTWVTTAVVSIGARKSHPL